jgi:flagellar hook-associated protein 2
MVSKRQSEEGRLMNPFKQTTHPLQGNLTELYTQNNNYLNAHKKWPAISSALPISYSFARLAHLEEAKTSALGFSHMIKSIHRIRKAAEALLDSKPGSAFHKRDVKSSDIDTVTGQAQERASLQALDITVNQLASEQNNISSEFQRNSISPIHTGTNQFDITVGKRTTSLSVFLLPSDTNEKALNKIKSAVNSAQISVYAKIARDDTKDTVSLHIHSRQTGADQAFSFSDRVGNVIASTGLSYVTHIAQNASYQINDENEKQSFTNEITLNEGKLSLSLHQVTNRPINIQVAPSLDTITLSISKLINEVNETHQEMGQKQTIFKPNVYPFLSDGFPDHELSGIGIDQLTDGNWMLDESWLKLSIEHQYEQTKDTMAGQAGWARHILDKAEQWIDQPTSRFMNDDVFTMKRFSLYQPDSQTKAPLSWTGIIMDKNY